MGWRVRHSMVDLSDGVFALTILAASVIGATAGTPAVWLWDRLHDGGG